MKTAAPVETRRRQTGGEEIANSVSHCVGALLAIAGMVILIVKAAHAGSAIGVVSAVLYGSAMILLYIFSTLYHALIPNGAKKVFRIFDHCSIFLQIFGSYIPVCLVLFGGWLGWTLFGVIGGCAILGIVLNAINLERWKKASLVLYIVMGWAVLIALKPLLSAVPLKSMWFLAGGGVMYMLGVPFYKMSNKRYFHFIWHLFVIAGSVLQYFFILFYVY